MKVLWRQIKQGNGIGHWNHFLEGFLKNNSTPAVSDSINWGWDYRICSFYRFPWDADVAGLGTHFWELLGQGVSEEQWCCGFKEDR